MKSGTQGFVGERLREGREARGLTATALAGLLGVTRSAVCQYEQGAQSPRPEVMENICQSLKLPLRFFTREKPENEGAIYWRSLASTTKLARKAVKRRLGWFQELSAYLSEYIDFPQPNFPAMELPSDPLKISTEDIERIAKESRNYWSLGEEPIPSVMTLLENNGVFISRDDLYATSLDGLSRWSPRDNAPFCLIASGKGSAVRSTMDLLHELGHLILHKHLDQRYVSTPFIHKVIEAQAFAFAGAFALPEESFAGDIYSLSLDSFVNLKARWKVSIGAMIKRGEALQIIPESQAEKLWRTIAAKGWRTEEPLDDELPIENPRLLSRAVEILLSEGLQTKENLINALAFPETDIEDIASLPRGTLSGANAKVQTMPSLQEEPNAATRDSQKVGNILSFEKKR